MNHVMLDLETFGSRPGSVIVSIGMVRFGATHLGEEFYRLIDPNSCVELGMTMDPGSIMWWLAQSDPARAALLRSPGEHIMTALRDASAYLSETANTCVWGNGATFDNVLLSEAYRMANLQRPWSYRLDRCFRTMKFGFPTNPPDREGTHHNALDDAKHQAIWLQTIYQKHKLVLE